MPEEPSRPAQPFRLAAKPEEWRNVVCSCTDCLSYDCFALRHESAVGCTCHVCEHSKTCMFYNKVKANLNATTEQRPAVKSPGQISYKENTSVPTSKGETPCYDNKDKCEKCNKDSLKFYKDIRTRLEKVQTAINQIKDTPHKQLSEVPPLTTLKTPPNISPKPSEKTLPLIAPISATTPAPTTGNNMPRSKMKVKHQKICHCKNKNCRHKEKTASSETIKTYRIVPIVDETHTDYVKVESTETYYASSESAPVNKETKVKRTTKTMQDRRSSNPEPDELFFSNRQMVRYDNIVQVVKHILKQNQEEERLARNINKYKTDEKNSSKNSDAKLEPNNNWNVIKNNICQINKDSTNINNKDVQKENKCHGKCHGKDDEEVIVESIVEKKYVVDSINLKKEITTDSYPDKSSKCKSKFCTISVDNGEKPFKKRIELQIVYDTRCNETNFNKQNDELENKPNQNICDPCSHTKTSAELSAQIMNVPYKEYTEYISQPKTAPKQKGSKYILKKIKDIYEACSCKVCECISSVVPTYTKEICNCKPCDCDECRAYGMENKNSVPDSFKKIAQLLSDKSENCDCKPCDCIECKSTKQLDQCACNDCQCIECKYSNIKTYRKYIVGVVGENQQRNCDCSPCGCFDCARPYGTVSSNRTTQETSTEVRRHLNCHCHPCNDVDCEQEGSDTCNCDRHNKVMRKPVLKDTQEYDIHHFTVSELGRNFYKSKKTDKREVAWLFSSTPKKSSNNINTNVSDALCTRFGCKSSKVDVPEYQSKTDNKNKAEWLFTNASNNQSQHEVLLTGMPKKRSENYNTTNVSDELCARFGCKMTKVDLPSTNQVPSAYQSKRLNKTDSEWLFTNTSKEQCQHAVLFSSTPQKRSDNTNVLDELCTRFGCKKTKVDIPSTNQLPSAYQSTKLNKKDSEWLFKNASKGQSQHDVLFASTPQNHSDKYNANVSDELCARFGCKKTKVDIPSTNQLPSAYQSTKLNKKDSEWLFNNASKGQSQHDILLAFTPQKESNKYNANVSDELCARFGCKKTKIDIPSTNQLPSAYQSTKLNKKDSEWLFNNASKGQSQHDILLASTPQNYANKYNANVSDELCARFGCKKTKVDIPSTNQLPSAYQSTKIDKKDSEWLFKNASKEQSQHSVLKKRSDNYNTNVSDELCARFGCKIPKVDLPSEYRSKEIDKHETEWLFNASKEQSQHNMVFSPAQKLRSENYTNLSDALCTRFGCKATKVVIPGVYRNKNMTASKEQYPHDKLFTDVQNKVSCKLSVCSCEEETCVVPESLVTHPNTKVNKYETKVNDNAYFNVSDALCKRFGCKEPIDPDRNALKNGAYQSKNIDKKNAAWLFSAVRTGNLNDDRSKINDSSPFCAKDTVAVALNLTHNFPTAKYFDRVKKSRTCDCKPCGCSKCIKHYKEGHDPNKHIANCYCEICECIKCESKYSDTPSAGVCDCKPCSCAECQKFLPTELRKYDYKHSESASITKETIHSCMDNSNTCYLSLLKAKESGQFLDKIITDKERKNRSQANEFYHSCKKSGLRTIPQVEMYCQNSNKNEYINKAHQYIKECRTNANSLKEKMYDTGNKSNVSKVSENTRTQHSKEKKTSLKSKTMDPYTCDSSLSLEPSTSEFTHVKESISMTSTEPKNRDTRSKESSCNSSGHDYSNYLIRFPKSTVETCISDVMNLDNYKKSALTNVKPKDTNHKNEYKTSTISGYLHNTIIIKDKDLSLNRGNLKKEVINIPNLKKCKNLNSDGPCDCQPCDCDKCSYKTIKYDRCHCDCSGCFCCGTCLSEDKSVCIRKNELTQTHKSQESGEVSWNSDHNINPETKTLVKQFCPTWNSEELEVSSDKDIQGKKLNQKYKNKNSTDERKSPLYKNDNCVMNSWVDMPYYDSVGLTLRNAKAFSLELLKILQNYEKANKNFNGMSQKFKILYESVLNGDVLVETEKGNKLEAPLLQEIKNNSNLIDTSQCHQKLSNANNVIAVESVTAESLEAPAIYTNNYVDNKNERNKILTDIYDQNQQEIMPITMFEDKNHEQRASEMKDKPTTIKDQNHKQENSEMKQHLEGLKNQFRMYSKLINRAIIKCRKEKWKKSGSGSGSRLSSRVNSRNYNKKKQSNTHEENVPPDSTTTNLELKKESNHKLNTVYLNTVDPKDLDSVSTDKTLDFENHKDSFTNSKKELLLDKDLLPSCKNLALEKEDALIDIPASFNNDEAMDCESQDEVMYPRINFSKGYYNITNKDIEEASTSQDETFKTEFHRKFESMPSVPLNKKSMLLGINTSIEKIASTNIVKTTSRYDPKKVTFETVRKLSDHSLLVKWKVPLITTDIEGYELLINGRSVQKVLGPSHNMAVVTCLPHTNKILLTVRTITLTSVNTGNYPATSIVYRLRSK